MEQILSSVESLPSIEYFGKFGDLYNISDESLKFAFFKPGPDWSLEEDLLRFPFFNCHFIEFGFHLFIEFLEHRVDVFVVLLVASWA